MLDTETKVLITMTEEQQHMFKSNGIIFNNGAPYYNLPQWYKDTDRNGVYEVLSFNQLPMILKNNEREPIFDLFDHGTNYTKSDIIKIIQESNI